MEISAQKTRIITTRSDGKISPENVNKKIFSTSSTLGVIPVIDLLFYVNLIPNCVDRITRFILYHMK